MKVFKPASVQATQPSYELHSLGWKAFQQLCVAITSEIWGQTVTSYFDSHDGGRDGAFHGSWTPQEDESFVGSFTVQCKFFSQSNKNLQLADLKDELAKATRLAERGLADNYIILTNARLTGTADEKLRTAFEAIPGIKRFAAYGADRLSQFIRESSRLRRLVPCVYGLGDLSQILDERAYAQAQEILSSLGGDLDKFVITQAYRQSVKALNEHGFVILLGEPACGKSMIAAMLAFGALDEWGSAALKIDSPEEFKQHANPHEPHQFFWIDDAFGATQLDTYKTANWNQAFPRIRAAMQRGAKVIFTSRDYIYRAASAFLKKSALPVLDEAQVVIQVEQLTQNEREQILYNHIQRGTQPNEFKHQIKPFLPAVAALPRFSPEIARRLGNPVFTKNLEITAHELEQFVEHPTELLQEIIRTLDTNSQSVIALIFMRGGSLPSPIDALTVEEERAIRLLGGDVIRAINSLATLQGSLVMQTQEGGNFNWRFKHPTIRDAFAALVAENREWMDIYLAGAPIERLLEEVSCGDIGLKGVKVIVPSDRYDMLLTRIDQEFPETGPIINDPIFALILFLVNRCDKEFFVKSVTKYPDIIPSLEVKSRQPITTIEKDLIVRLHQIGLLPEHKRLLFAAALCEWAVTAQDASFLAKNIREILTPTEFDSILKHIRSELIPNLDFYISDRLEIYTREDDPWSIFGHLISALTNYLSIFTADLEATISLKNCLEKIYKFTRKLVLQDMLMGLKDKDSYSKEDWLNKSRSAFDDVDQ